MARKFALVLIATMIITGFTYKPVRSADHQTSRVVTKCFPKKLWGIIRHIERKTGKTVIITSGLRHKGRRGSQHRFCKAADIRVAGVSIKRLKAIARTAPGIGGIGTYHGKGILHVDVGSDREWTH